ncbi:uncharacterized protein tasor2 isoform X2 [Fundulus heteroclitus]|uniref:uncharacterized protein tasor2 isoform X2 n=1 Tax=Fundulus heteroclitus TaxID=8078 RepID=UPI00165A36B1|nr:uncharacterized protein tasor2 isoform X2 [Fundulus heteroclitus]
MESGNGAASGEGILIPVSESSEDFQSKILAPLQDAYLYEESELSFRYKSALLVKNPDLEDKYNAFREVKRNAGYSEEELQETYGFLLFDDGSKANAVAETGVISGNNTCTTLGDPAKGVYISMYSDCLDLNRWYHGKSGYIAIIRLTKGKVKSVAENYTQNFTEPTVGFDCHVSEQLPTVSAKTSSFLAFERTQFYLYEAPPDGSSGASRPLSAAYPFAVVSFSYMDTKASAVLQERSEVEKQVSHYLPWRGQLLIESHFYHVELISAAGASIPAQLPPVIKVKQAIHMSVLRDLLPRAVFETSYTEEVFLEGFYCSLCDFVPSEANEANSFALLLSEIREKEIALCVPLNDGGFLNFIHSSHFLRYDDVESASVEVMKGLFLFPDSRVITKDIKSVGQTSTLSHEILRVLPALSYAEGEAEKTSTDPNDELCEAFALHMQSYATLINPGFPSSPLRTSRELSIFPDQYDVAEAYKHLYSAPEWNNRTWQTVTSYLNKPASFQLPVAKVAEILASGQEERREELDDDVYICLSSPEEAPTSPVGMEAEDSLADEQSLSNIEASMDIALPSAELQIAPIPVSQSLVADNLQSEEVTKDDEKCTDLTEQLSKPDDPEPLTPPTSEDLPAELIVKITSAEPSVPDEVSAAKHTDFHLSGLSTIAKLQTAEVNVVDEPQKVLDFSVVTKLQTSAKRRKRRRKCSKVRKKVSKNSVKSLCLKTVISSAEVEDLNCGTEQHKEELNLPQLRNPLKPKSKKLYKRKRRFGKLSLKSKKLRAAAVESAKNGMKKSQVGLESLESSIFLGVEPLPLRKKTERWDLKPIMSECGRILLPFGSVDFSDHVKSMQRAKKDECLEKLSPNVPVKLPETVVMDKPLGTALETAVAEASVTSSADGEAHHLHPEDGSTPPVDDSVQVPLTPNLYAAFPGNNDTNGVPLKTDEAKRLESFVRVSAKGEILLRKLKSVLSRRKRSLALTLKEQQREDADLESEACCKKPKVDSDNETPKGNDATPQRVSVSEMVSVDPGFAYYLGLIPKGNLKKVQNTKELDTPQRKASTEEKDLPTLDKQPQTAQSPQSIFTRSKIKTLKRHSGISAENVAKKCTAFQVPPLHGSTRLLNHHRTIYGDGTKTLHPSVSMEDMSEQNKAAEYRNKLKQKVKFSRTIVIKEKNIVVTRQWEENYNFSLDSRFTSDPRNKVVIRALHGPWDLSMQDTTEETKLIYHMWIGLFYSRSTPRFFQMDSAFMQPCSQERGSLEMGSGVLSGQTRPKSLISTAVTLSGPTKTPDLVNSKVLDLSKKETTVSEPESQILCLSVKSLDAKPVSSEQQLAKQVMSMSSEPLKTKSAVTSPADLQEKETFQFNKEMVHFGNISNEDKDVNTKTAEAEHEVCCVDHKEIPSSTSDGTLSQPEEMKNMPLKPETAGVTFEIEPVLHESSKETCFQNVVIEHGKDAVKSLLQEDAWCSATSVMDKEVNSNMDESNVTHPGVPDDVILKAKESSQMGNNPCQGGNRNPSVDTLNTQNTFVNDEESDVVCNGNVANEKQLNEESQASLDKTSNLEGNMDCCTRFTENEFENENDCLKKDGEEGETCISADHIDRDLRNQLLPKPCDGLVHHCYSSESSLIQMKERLSFSDGKENACLGVDPIVLKADSPTFNTPPDIATKFEDTAPQVKLYMNKTDSQKMVLPVSDEDSYSFEDSCKVPCLPLDENRVECLNDDKASDLNLNTCSNDSKSPESNSALEEENIDKPLLQPQDSPSKCEVNDVCEVDEQLTGTNYPKTEETSSSQSKILNSLLNPCIAKYVSGENVLSQDEVEKVVQVVTEPIAPLPDKMCGTSEVSSKMGELSPCKIPILDETCTPEVFGKEFVSRSPTTTGDEKHVLNLCSRPSNTMVVLSDGEDCQNVTENSTLSTDEVNFKQVLQPSAGGTNPISPSDLGSDVKIRTLRVLQSINTFLSTSNNVDMSSRIETPGQKISLDTSISLSKKSVARCLGLSHLSGGSRNKQTKNQKAAPGSSCTLQNLYRKPADVPTSCVKSKSEDFPSVKKQMTNKHLSTSPHDFKIANSQETPVDPNFHSYETVVSEGLQEEQKTSHSNLSNESHPYSQHLVRAVKPSKSEESQAHCLSKDMDPKSTSQSKQASSHVAKYSSPTSMLLRETKQLFKENCDRLNNSVSEPSSKTTQLAKRIYSKYVEEDKFALLNSHHQSMKKNMSKHKTTPSSSQCSKSKGNNEFWGQHPKFMKCSVNGTVEDKTLHGNQGDSSEKSLICDKYDTLSEDNHIAGLHTSLKCTVFNTGQKRSYSFLEQVSQRCLKNDLTQASMEQECLIFSEQMKNLIKKRKTEPLYQPDTYDSSVSRTSPLTISFSNLEEEEDSTQILDIPVFRQKIKVDMSDRKDRTATTEEGRVFHSVSQDENNPMKYTGNAAITAECARLYNAKMKEVCSAKKILPRPRQKRGGPSTDTSSHFDFCGQMKKELDETFWSNQNAVVKRACKTKYRFHILVTSDEFFFKETKAQMEAEGHTAVQPSEFFLGKDSSSSLVIILRNEDIADHICKIPHLLKLKMTPGVLFAGIDEPDDVINLTHQELFTQAGFVMFDRAVLEPLSICNLQKISKTLEELGRTGKWKWMLHYRDSRRMKENARLSEEANDKKLFMYWCQDAGILEVLPYHECDQMAKGQPDYLACLRRLQVHHVSSRFAVFVTDSMTDGAFEKNGILTMTLDTFLTKSATEIFRV